jgi:hypothetical protein
MQDYINLAAQARAASAAAQSPGGSGTGSMGNQTGPGNGGNGNKTPTAPGETTQAKEVYGHQTGTYLGKMTLAQARER